MLLQAHIADRAYGFPLLSSALRNNAIIWRLTYGIRLSFVAARGAGDAPLAIP